ncbi:hypothetical protein RQP46_007948 [Phenoliferia psychrophenolica]
MLSLENINPLIYSNIGFLGAFVWSPVVVATALTVEGLSLAIRGTSVFSQQQQQLAKAEPAPAPTLATRAAPAPLPILPIPAAPIVLSDSATAAAVGIDAGSNSPSTGSSTGDSVLVDDKKDTDDVDLAERMAKFGRDDEAGMDSASSASESGSHRSFHILSLKLAVAILAVLAVLELVLQLLRLVGHFAKRSYWSSIQRERIPQTSTCFDLHSDILAAPQITAALRAAELSRPRFSNSFHDLKLCIPSPNPAHNVSATVVEHVAKPIITKSSTLPQSKPSLTPEVPIIVVAPAAAQSATPHLASSSPPPAGAPSHTTPPRSQIRKPTSPSRLSLLAIKVLASSRTKSSTSHTRDTPLPPSPTARPASSTSSVNSPTLTESSQSTPTLLSSPEHSTIVAPARTPELTPPPTLRRKRASPFNGAPRPSTSTSSPTLPLSPSPSTSSSPPLPLRPNDVKPAGAPTSTGSTSRQSSLFPFAGLSVSDPFFYPTSTSTSRELTTPKLPITPPKPTNSLLPSLPISSASTPLTRKSPTQSMLDKIEAEEEEEKPVNKVNKMAEVRRRAKGVAAVEA